VATLSGKVVVVSGAGSVGEGVGNGRAAAILLARAGASVVVVDIVPEAAEETARLIAADGNTAHPVAADVTNQESAAEAIAVAIREFDRIDILVNNVGIIGAPGNAVTVELDAWDHVLRVNLTSILLMSKFAIPHIVAGGGGAVVNIASGAGILGGHPAIAYPTSKGAVISMTRAMAYHHGPDGVRVNCIAPGYVFTPRVAQRATSEGALAALRESRRLSAPLEVEGTGWDIGHAVVYLASDEARWVSGVVLPVDGGFVAGKV
jgi:NAD(P)-dependent dehydrogenase (short-subunit alcohol dehydrogenase family)